MKVPFVDLSRTNTRYISDFQSDLKKVVETSNYTGGAELQPFEYEFAEFCGAKYGLGISSGTAALHLGLLAAGIGSGDEVIVPANTYIATAEAVAHTGARPRFCDVSGEHYNIDIQQIEKYINKNTRAVLAVHLYGMPCEIIQLREFCDRNNLLLFEDVAQACGGEFANKKLGTFGEMGFFSFFPSKNLGALSDGGAIVTDSEKLFLQLKLLRSHGEKKKGSHSKLGYNQRLSRLQMMFLSRKLKNLPDDNEKRLKVAKRYDEGLAFLKPYRFSEGHVFHLYPIFVKEREKLQSFLGDKGVGTGVHYPTTCHLQESFSYLEYRAGDLPVAEKLASQQLSLPMFPEITGDEISYVIDSVKEFYR